MCVCLCVWCDNRVTLDKDNEIGQPLSMSTPRRTVEDQPYLSSIPLIGRVRAVDQAVTETGTKLYA